MTSDLGKITFSKIKNTNKISFHSSAKIENKIK